MERYRARFPKRFVNMGVAEQNMIGVATGLAEAGFIPYAYSIATFAALRPFEFIRNGPVLHKLPVRIIGMGMGYEYGHAGPTHHALEDIGALRTLTGLTVVIPADPLQAAAAIRATASLSGPVYYSLGKGDHLSVDGLNGRFELGRAQTVREGNDVAIMSMGSVSSEAVAAADQLRLRGIHARVAIVSNFYPDPNQDVLDVLRDMQHAITVEAQTISGGLAAYVSSVIASNALGCRLWPLAVGVPPDGRSGSQVTMWRKHGLDRDNIVGTVREALEEKT
jgi:transketolase